MSATGTPLYDVTVQLSGSDGNAYAVLGRIQGALRKAGASSEAIRDFVKEAKAGDYDHLLQTAMKYVNLE